VLRVEVVSLRADNEVICRLQRRAAGGHEGLSVAGDHRYSGATGRGDFSEGFAENEERTVMSISTRSAARLSVGVSSMTAFCFPVLPEREAIGRAG
jgi:hypothetical protein